MSPRKMLSVISLGILCLWTSSSHAGDNWPMIEDALLPFAQTFGHIPQEIKTVAVFKITGVEEKLRKPLQQHLEKQLISSEGRFSVIDRETVDALLTEQSMSMSGAVDNATMIKAGKLIGVQGYFVVDAQVSSMNAAISVKLIDVETGAIVMVKDFTAEKLNVSHLGISGGFAYTPPLGRNGDILVTENDVIYMGPLAPESVNQQAMMLSVFFVSGLSALPNIKMGFEAALYHFDLTDDKLEITDKDAALYTNSSLQGGYYPGFSLHRAMGISFRPRVYYILNRFFDVSLAARIEAMGVEQQFESSTPTNYNEDEEEIAMVFMVAPMAGIDFHITKVMSAYLDFTYYLTNTEFTKENKWVDGITYSYSAVIHRGPQFDIGIRFHPFRW